MQQEKIITKLFIGFEVTSEINMYLTDSIAWKNAQLENLPGTLKRIHYSKKEYIGLQLPFNQTPLLILRELNESLKEALLTYCPKISPSKLKSIVFSQTFIA